MSAEQIWLGNTEVPSRTTPVEGDFVTMEGERYARISNVDRMTPFFMSVISNSDHWLFVGSNGPFTAGRVAPEYGLFPYQTVDKILRAPDTSGARSVLLVRRGGRLSLWEPWQESGRAYHIERNLYKQIDGAGVLFEEINADLGLRFRWSLTTCEPYGLVRRCQLENLGAEPVEVRYLDGWNHLITPGVTQDLYMQFSYLVAGYMRHGRAPASPLGIFTLNATLTDRAVPYESLRAAACWSLGHPAPTVLLCDRQVEAFRRGEPVQAETEVRGEFGAYLIVDSVTLPPGGGHRWVHAADTQLDHAALIRLEEELLAPERLTRALEESIAANRDGLRRRIAAADGLQQTADTAASAHHYANTLFNCLRGGVFPDSYRFPTWDLAAFLRARNVAVTTRHREWLETLPAVLTLEQLRAEAACRNDPQLTRLTAEYLPLTFSRRHGDPSRPWNHFAIQLKDAAGNPRYGYQGNWRDIFQNWESLALSYPEALGAMISVFLNASTADGYNPYRITRDGVDWEAPDPNNPWSHIGYWGDHQIVYLLRLLEGYERVYPGRLAADLRQARYSYVQVPYEIADLDAMLADPRHTIAFDRPLHETLLARARERGADGRLLAAPDGEVLLAPLAEKLLVPLLAKLSNLVPEGGIWLNTQRPEWNDANNALAGWGLSVVTVHYLRRYLAFCDGLLAEAADASISLAAPLARFMERITVALEKAQQEMSAGCDDATRYRVLVALGRAGEEYRATLYRDGLYRDGSEGRTEVPVIALRALIAAALPVVDQTLRANRRPDGLYHSYNVLQLAGERAAVRHLSPMLEGQVAALSSGLLAPAEVLALLRALRASDLYVADRHSYLLYPDRNLPPFLERNTLPPDAAERAPLLAALVAANDLSLVVADLHGPIHFQADLRNADDVAAQLDRLAAEPQWQDAIQRDRQTVLDLWEELFRHAEFTGRSGTFFMFEGLGSIYWHMVAKLLVAVQECWREATQTGVDPAVVAALADAYHDIRDGLGFRKTPASYGAFPIDPYSHTPAHRGAQQPGMTGQVKEELLTRRGELGVEVDAGRLRFAPRLLPRAEFFSTPQRFDYTDLDGADRALDLPADSLAFTCCGTPVVYALAEEAGIRIERADGSGEEIAGDTLSAGASASLFARQGDIRQLTVHIPSAQLL